VRELPLWRYQRGSFRVDRIGVREHVGEVELGREPPVELLGGYEPAAQKRFTEVAAVVPLVLEGLAYVVFVDLAEGLISI